MDTRTPEDLMNIIEAKAKEVAEALAALRRNGQVKEAGERHLGNGNGYSINSDIKKCEWMVIPTKAEIRKTTWFPG